MTTPPILDEIRRVRHEMSAEINHDPVRLVEYFAALEKQNAFRVVNLADQGPKGRKKDPTETDASPPSDGNVVSSVW